MKGNVERTKKKPREVESILLSYVARWRTITVSNWTTLAFQIDRPYFAPISLISPQRSLISAPPFFSPLFSHAPPTKFRWDGGGGPELAIWICNHNHNLNLNYLHLWLWCTFFENLKFNSDSDNLNHDRWLAVSKRRDGSRSIKTAMNGELAGRP